VESGDHPSVSPRIVGYFCGEINRNRHAHRPALPLDNANLTHNFQKTLSDAQIRKQRFHDLRHWFAMQMLTQGADLRTMDDVLSASD